MKFSNIKVGDDVLVEVKYTYAFNSSLTYKVRQKVTRVTPTQFLVGETKFYKEDGCLVGDRWTKAYSMSDIGQKISQWEPVLEDQTEQYKEDIKKVKMVKEIKKNLEQLDVNNAPLVIQTNMANLEALLAVSKKFVLVSENVSS